MKWLDEFLRRWTLRRRVAIASLLGALVLAALGGGVLWREHQFSDAMREIHDRQVQPMQTLQRIDATMKDVRFRLSGVLLDQVPVSGARQHLQNAMRDLPAAWSAYEASQKGDALPAERAELNARVGKGVGKAVEFMRELEKAYAAQADDGQLASFLSDEWPKVQAALVNPLEALLPMAAASVKATYEVQESRASKARAVEMAVIAGVLVAFAVIAWWFIMTIDRGLGDAARAVERLAEGRLDARLPVGGKDEIAQFGNAFNASMERLSGAMAEIRERAESIDRAAGEIAQGNQDLSSRTEQQASHLAQTSASTGELSGTVHDNHAHAANAARLAGESAQQAQEVGETVQRAVATMGTIDESARRIGQIVAVIDGIAFQTNILALNAAVEAARAGEAGRGFAVVASEVRTLAGRSAEASREIRDLVGTSTARVAEGSTLVTSVGDSMGKVLDSAREVATLVGAIATASESQAAGIAQISEAVSQMDQGTQQNAAMVEEAAAASQALQGQAAGLRELVDQFEV